jgi:hypothetical protein
MPKLSIVVPHHLTESEALSRIQGLLGDVKQQYATYFTDLHESWTGNDGTFSLKAMGFNVSGSVSVKPSQVEMRADLPLAATPFRGRIEQVMREETERLLA